MKNSIHQSVYWYPGLYLQPQHFQSIDINNEIKASRHILMMSPYHYGISRIELDSDELENFVIDLIHAEFIMPDGTHLIKDVNCVIEKRSFHEHWVNRDKPFMLWFALHKLDFSAPNVSLRNGSPGGITTRWISTEDKMMKDMYGDGPESPVSRIQYYVRVLFEEEKEKSFEYVTLPFARVCLNQETVKIDDTFAPPCTSIISSISIENKTKKIQKDLNQRARQIEEYKHVNGFKRVEDLLILNVMMILNRTVSTLNYVSSSPGCHPWFFYGILSQLVAELSSFNHNISFSGEWKDNRPSLKEYDHNQLMSCLNSAHLIIIEILNGIIIDNNTYVLFEKRTTGLHIASLGNFSNIDNQSGKFILSLKSPFFINNHDLERNASNIKLIAYPELDNVIKFSLPGVRLECCHDIPPGIPDREDTLFYFIDVHDPGWSSIFTCEQAAFYWGESPDDLDVSLIYLEDL